MSFSVVRPAVCLANGVKFFNKGRFEDSGSLLDIGLSDACLATLACEGLFKKLLINLEAMSHCSIICNYYVW